MADEEFPCLKSLGLYAQNIDGDGNCLFSALSDQIFGSVNRSAEIRANTIEYIKTNKSFYINYIDVVPGGGTRRQPKRKAATAYSASAFGRKGPSASEIDKAFENHVRDMARNGTYGGNMEIVAFAACYGYHVRIYQTESSYLVDSPAVNSVNGTAHIAYHASYLHYSSVRNAGGPHSGLPEVKLPPNLQQVTGSYPAAWAIKVVIESCPYPIDENTAIQTLALSGNDVGNAITYLYEQDAGDSTPDVNSVQSSSVERELGSDEEVNDGPQKRQDRRLSRARKEHQHKAWLNRIGALPADSLESLLQSEASSVREDVDSGADGPASSPSPLVDGSTSPDSDYSPAPEEVIAPPSMSKGITLSLKPSKQVKQAKQAPRMVIKTNSSPKKPAATARDTKALKKQAQKQARKARSQKQAPHMLENMQPDPLDSSQSSFDSHSSFTDGFRVISI